MIKFMNLLLLCNHMFLAAKLVCHGCQTEHFQAKCDVCTEAIIGTRLIYSNQNYHYTCKNCGSCGKIGNSRYYKCTVVVLLFYCCSTVARVHYKGPPFKTITLSLCIAPVVMCRNRSKVMCNLILKWGNEVRKRAKLKPHC